MWTATGQPFSSSRTNDMSVAFQYDQVGFARQCQQIAELSRRSLSEDVIPQRAGLFTRYASGFTPPFGTAPIKESATTKRKIGLEAVRKDVRRLFRPLESLRLYAPEQPKAKAGGHSLGFAIRAAAKKGNYTLAQELLRKAKIHVRGVVKEPTDELLNAMRDKHGRIQKVRGYVTVSGEAKQNRFIKHRQERVGLAKDGWSMALLGLNQKVPAWVEKQSADGVFISHLTGDKPEITVGNPVDYIQWTAPRIEQQAWGNLFRNTEKEAQILERAARKKLREAGIQAS